jgi:enoyl-CoA hydratase/carnithine racemase
MAATAELPVLFERAAKGAAVVTLNRPRALNALTLPMVRLLAAEVPRWRRADTSLVLLKGAGGRAFCAGGDIKAIAEARDDIVKQGAFFAEE